MAQDPNVADHVKQMTATANQLSYAKQAQFFLNAFWKEHKDDAEELWIVVEKMKRISLTAAAKERKQCQHSLDRFKSSQVLELLAKEDQIGEILTSLKLKEVMKEIDKDFDDRMSFFEYALYKYKNDNNVNIEQLMTRPQGKSKLLDELEEQLSLITKKQKDISSKLKKWENVDPSTLSGVKKITYDNDKLVLDTGADFLKEKLDLAQKKFNAAQNSKDMTSPGKTWWLGRELSEAQKYKPPKKVLKK